MTTTHNGKKILKHKKNYAMKEKKARFQIKLLKIKQMKSLP